MSSSPRRLRPPQPQPQPPPSSHHYPKIPSTYLSPDFCAATHVLTLLSQSPNERSATISTLVSVRDTISTSLRSQASEWDQLTPSVSRLHSTLAATQRVTHLRGTLSTISKSPALASDYCDKMAAATAKTELLSRNVTLAASVKELAILLEDVDAANSDIMAAEALIKASTLAASQSLRSIPALESVRNALDTKRAALQTSLHSSLLNSVFEATTYQNPETTVEVDVNVSTRSSAAASAKAIDLLSGSGAAARSIKEAAATRLITLIRDTIASSISPPPVSFASSSFTPAPPDTPPFSIHSAASASLASSSKHAAHVFRQDVTSNARIEARTIVEKVTKALEHVLNNITALVTTTEHDKKIQCAAKYTADTIDHVLVAFVSALLGFSTAGTSANHTNVKNQSNNKRRDDPRDSSTGISLIPKSNALRKTHENLAFSWELERGYSAFESFLALLKTLPALTQSIYNLEVIYQPLHDFVKHCQNVRTSWKLDLKKTDDYALSHPQTLSQLLDDSIEIFVRRITQDVKAYMDDVFGNRAGTLLQPISIPHTSMMVSTGLRYTLPPLSQTQLVIDVVGSCLSLSASVPSMADRLGKLINDHVLTPYSERATYALNLAASWTDAGKLMTKMKEHALSQRETYGVVHKQEELRRYTTMSQTEAQNRRQGIKKKDDYSNSNLVRVIRNNSELSVKCLTGLTSRQRQELCKHPRLLNESEWNAVVRLIANAQIVLNELEQCVNEQEDLMKGKIMHQSNIRSTSVDKYQWMNLRDVFQERNLSATEQKIIARTIRTTEMACRTLREDVMERGVVLLHCEVMLHCFCQVARILSEGFRASGKLIESSSDEESSETSEENITKPIREEYDQSDEEKATDIRKQMKPLKAVLRQLSEFGGGSDSSAAKNEFDEFGDRITTASDTVIEADTEDCNLTNNFSLDQGDHRSFREREDGSIEGGVFAANAASPTPPVSKLDRKVVEKGHDFGMELRYRDGCLKSNLMSEDRDFVFCKADEAVSLGIRMSGDIKPQGDRDVATGARLLVDAIAKEAAESIGWPLVESDYSVAEGSSQSASECRTLLYAAGMM